MRGGRGLHPALAHLYGADQALKGLQQWIREAWESGIHALQKFAGRLKGYAATST